MTVAMILLTCGRVELTRRTLESFSAHNPDARERFLLLHADDASPEGDGTLALAQAHGFETVVHHTTRRGFRTGLAEAVYIAAERGADWVVTMDNDMEWVRPFPWALFDYITGHQPNIYALRLFGRFKDRDRTEACFNFHLGLNRRPVTWRALAGAPEHAEVARIHWGGPLIATRIREMLDLQKEPLRPGYDPRGDHRPEIRQNGHITAEIARVVSNVAFHIGKGVRTPLPNGVAPRTRRGGWQPPRPARPQRAYTFQVKPKTLGAVRYAPGGRSKTPPLYTPAWQQTRTWTSEGSTRCLEIALATLERPASLLDVGCGDGHLVRRAIQVGVESVGVDLSAEGPEHADLREPLDLQRTFDWVFCWEVAEHLPAESADTLCDSLVRHLAPGGTLLFTAAHPGQRGDGHINEQPQLYWRDKLEARGLRFDAVQTHRLSATWLREAPRTPWYGTNLQVFEAPGTRVKVTPPLPRIAITMRTANRAPHPNYVGGTIRRLLEQGIPADTIHLCVTAPETDWLDRELEGYAVRRHVPASRLSPNQNGLEQIRVLDPLQYDYVLLLEDDLAFCADFMGSIARWLRVAERRDRNVYRFFSFRVRPPSTRNQVAYDWPLKNMCGTQAVLMRMADAQDFLAWADLNLETWGGFRGNAKIAFDKLMAAWALHKWPGRPGVLSHPFFVRHVGHISSIHPASAHMDSLFAGPRWSFRPQQVTA